MDGQLHFQRPKTEIQKNILIGSKAPLPDGLSFNATMNWMIPMAQRNSSCCTYARMELQLIRRYSLQMAVVQKLLPSFGLVQDLG